MRVRPAQGENLERGRRMETAGGGQGDVGGLRDAGEGSEGQQGVGGTGGGRSGRLGSHRERGVRVTEKSVLAEEGAE